APEGTGPCRVGAFKRRLDEEPERSMDMKTPPIVSPQEWQGEREAVVGREEEFSRGRDALAAERRRMPWMAVEKEYRFEGPDGPATLAELFAGRRQLIVYRALYRPAGRTRACR